MDDDDDKCVSRGVLYSETTDETNRRSLQPGEMNLSLIRIGNSLLGPSLAVQPVQCVASRGVQSGSWHTEEHDSSVKL